MITPAIQTATETEVQALRLAVIWALKSGLATDNLESDASRESLLSVAHKLGVDVLQYLREGEAW